MPTPPSILIVLHDFALGGTERIALRLARAWALEGARVTIFCGSQEGPLRPLAGDDVRIAVADPPIRRGRGSRLRLAHAARRFAIADPHDAAFVPGNFHWLVGEALSPILPTVVQVSAALQKPQRGWLRQLLFERRMRRQLAHAAAIVTLADAFRDQAQAILGTSNVLVIALPALDDDGPEPVPMQAGRSIVAAGRLVREKGFATLIAAFARLEGQDSSLNILGDGPERTDLHALAQRLGCGDRVMLSGYVDDIRPYLDASRLFVLSSQHEGYCAVLVEALAAGRPVVATDCTPATALLAEGGGEVVPIDDIEAMAAAIARQLDGSPPDPRILADRVEHHRIGPVSREYLALFDRVAAR